MMDAVTGVTHINHCNDNFFDVIYRETYLDTGWDRHRKECKNPETCCHEYSGPILLGGWKKTWQWKRRGQVVPPYTPGGIRRRIYVEDQSSEYAAVYHPDDGYIQVGWSKYTQIDCRDCTFCFPNQADLLSSGGVTVGYILPFDYLNLPQDKWIIDGTMLYAREDDDV